MPTWLKNTLGIVALVWGCLTVIAGIIFGIQFQSVILGMVIILLGVFIVAATVNYTSEKLNWRWE